MDRNAELDAVAHSASVDWLEDARAPRMLRSILAELRADTALACLDAGEDLWRMRSDARFSIRGLYASGVRHQAWEVRYASVAFSGGYGLSPHAARKLLRDPVHAVAVAAARWLLECYPDEPGWRSDVERFKHLMGHEPLALELLGRSPSLCVVPASWSQATPPEPDTFFGKILHLRDIEMGAPQEAATSALEHACFDDDPCVRVYAARRLGWLVGQVNFRRIAEVLLALLDVSVLRLTQVVALSLKECCDDKHPPPAVVDALCTLARHEDVLTRAAALYSLRDAGGASQDVREYVQACVVRRFDEEASPRMRFWIIETLWWLMPVDTWFSEYGFPALTDSRYYRWRSIVPELLLADSPYNPSAIESLIRSIQDRTVRAYVRRRMTAAAEPSLHRRRGER